MQNTTTKTTYCYSSTTVFNETTKIESNMENKLYLQQDFNKQLKINATNNEAQQIKSGKTPQYQKQQQYQRIENRQRSNGASNYNNNSYLQSSRSNNNRNGSNKDILYDNDLLNENDSCTKKQNLNHLLNFKYIKRENNDYDYENKMMKQFWSTKLNKNSIFTKEQFLQANCQFIVNESNDYNIHFTDPDLLVDWEKIEEIQINTHDTITCPICLYEPQAGKMTKCGHIYCWCCMLHYLALSDKQWRKCPICFESIYKKDLKSCKIIKQQEFKVNDEIELNLMFRELNSTILLPVHNLKDIYEKNTPKALNDFNRVEYENGQQFLKLKGSSNELILNKIIKRERDELVKQLKENEDEPEVCFINSALGLLDEREVELKAKDIMVSKNKENVPQQQQQQQQNAVQDDDRKQQKTCINQLEELYYLYQSNDGQRIFLSSLNFRCLIHEYKSIINCPLKINAKIVAIDGMFMDDELRKRYKYLSHLPLHSDFKFVELDLKEPILSKETLNVFESEIEAKRLNRYRKEKEDMRRLRRYESTLNASDPYYTNYSDFYTEKPAKVESSINFNNEDFPIIDDYEEQNNKISTSMSPPTPTTASNNQQQCSFAQMLKHETAVNKNESLWPKLASSPNTGLSSTTPVWVKKEAQQSVSGKTIPTNAHNNNDEDLDNVDEMYVPGYKESFLMAIDSALQSAKSSKDEESGKNKAKDSKKKKKTKNLLFSTF